MFIKKLLLLIGLSFLFTGCSTTGMDGDLHGSVLSQNKTTEMGTRYLLGRGVPQNNRKAFEYFQQASEEGDSFAQNEVAYMYAAGKGTPKDYSQALVYYTKAAEQNLASAQYNLGLMYATGLGTPVDYQMARQWYEKAAGNGFEPAKIALAKLKS
jgi:TPR repeat protein